MGCQKGDDADGYSIRQEPDTAGRPQSLVPEGLRQICVLALSLTLRICYGYSARFASRN
jgi:hypothetical protein